VLHTPKGLYGNDLVLQFDRFDHFASPPSGCETGIETRQRREYLMRVVDSPDTAATTLVRRQRAEMAGAGPGVELADYVSPEALCTMGPEGEVQLSISLSLPHARVRAVPVRALRIMPPSLLQTLEGIGQRGSMQTGTLTMDSTRRLLPLMAGDPKAFHLSLVGLWLTGLAADGLESPHIWAACR